MTEREPFRITGLHAFVAIDPRDPTGDEGVCAIQGPDGAWMPLVAADPVRLAALRPYALRLARRMRCPVKLVRFDVRTDLETLDP